MQELYRYIGIMEDLDKYIFDPKNPKACKVYSLLLKIVKKKNNIAFLSPFYFFNVFEDLVLNKEMIDEMWNMPDDFDSLPIVDKLFTYIENYSAYEFLKDIEKNSELFPNKNINKIFASFLIGYIPDEDYQMSNDSIVLSINKRTVHFDVEQTLKFGAFERIFLEKKSDIKIDREFEQFFPIHMVIFLDSKTFNFKNFLTFRQSSILITTVEDYQTQSFEITNLKPLLLKDIKDIHVLLDVLYRDLTQEKAKEQPIENIPYINEISIKNFFAIDNLKLQTLKNEKEIYFVGENGDGKTVLLQAITLALKGNQQEGIIVDFIKQNPKKNASLKANDTTNTAYSYSEDKQSYRNLFAYGAHRHRNDSDKAEEIGYLTLFNDEQYLNNPVKWLQHLDYKQAKGEETSISLETAKELLKSILDNNVEIEVSPDEVAFIERGTKLKFEQLSEGYKSVIVWVSDLIKRLSDNQPYAISTEDFKGIVLVDEVELHLHPKWKYRIVKDLRTWFPGIQFIFTTHSPTIILGASPDAVFYKVYKEEGVTKISSPIQDISHLTANSLLTSPLFELESMAPRSMNLVENRNISSDDYIYQKIHQVVADKINNTPNLVDADVMRMVEEELKKLESEK